MFYETNIFIQLQEKNIFILQNISVQLFKFPDIDKFLFNKAPPPYPCDAVKMLFLGGHAALNMLFPGYALVFQRRGSRGLGRWSFVEYEFYRCLGT